MKYLWTFLIGIGSLFLYGCATNHQKVAQEVFGVSIDPKISVIATEREWLRIAQERHSAIMKKTCAVTFRFENQILVKEGCNKAHIIAFEKAHIIFFHLSESQREEWILKMCGMSWHWEERCWDIEKNLKNLTYYEKSELFANMYSGLF